MPPTSRPKKSRTGSKSKLLAAVKKHPIRTASIAGGAAIGIALISKAANTAAKVITIKAATEAATDVARAVRGGGKRKGKGS